MPEPAPTPRRSWWDKLPILQRRPRLVEGLTVNDDFTDRVTDIPDLIKRRSPAFIGIQEGKRHNYGEVLQRRIGWPYDVRQELATDGTAGVAVVWDVQRCRPIGVGINEPDEIGGGWLELTPAGSGLTARGVGWQDLDVRVGALGSRSKLDLRVGSGHRPPQRDRHLWPLFDERMAMFCKDSPIPVLIFMDCNEAGGPTALLEKLEGTGIRWYGEHFDGALTNLRVPGGAVALDRGSSDHKPISIPVEI